MHPSVVSLAARALRARLATALGIPAGSIFIGHPAMAVGKAENQPDKQFLNLFVYQLEHSGYPADALATDPTYLRLHCLITPFGNDDTGSGAGKATAGENDLKLIGGVVAALHEAPTLRLQNDDTDDLALLQIIPLPFSVENINNLWATQVNTSYRPSVAYELSLAPVPFTSKREKSPLTGARDVMVQAFPSTAIGGEGGAFVTECEIRFVSAQGELGVAMALPGSGVPAEVSVAIAGRPGETVTLRWELWSPAAGWSAASATQDVPVPGASLDPSRRVLAQLPAVAPTAPRQYLLVATGSWRRADGSVAEIRSNRLLISVFGDPTP